MGYSSAVVTAKGQELMEKVLAGESKITFTKVGTSEKAYAEYKEKQSLVPNIEKDAEDNVCKIKCVAVFSNTDLTEGYYINTIVLYAKGDDGEEIAFSYIETDGTGKYMEAYNSQHPQSIQFTIYTGLTVNDETSVVVDPDGIVTIEYLNKKINGKDGYIDSVASKTNLPTASADYLNKKCVVKDTNTIYKCIEQNGEYVWVKLIENGIIYATYAELKALKDAKGLVIGQKYRIIDYVTTVNSSLTEYKSAGHQFDLIVKALDSETFSEDAKAIQHEGDTYFANCRIENWSIKYSFNNIGWSDTTNGKGVILLLEDEKGNVFSYDFKNIMRKIYKITANTKQTDYVGQYGAIQIGASTNTTFLNSTFSLTDYKYCYTFNYTADSYATCKDLSMESNVRSNKFGDYYLRRLGLTINLWVATEKISIDGNTAKAECHDNIFLCSSNNCVGNSFGNNCSSNSFGNNCSYNSFGNGCSYNSFGNDYCSNSFGNNCYSNSFGNNCSYNSFGNGCSSNSFGNYYCSNSFGNNCYYNSFGNGCCSNSFGNKFSQNKIGNRMTYCSFNCLDTKGTGGISYNFFENNVMYCKWTIGDSAFDNYVGSGTRVDVTIGNSEKFFDNKVEGVEMWDETSSQTTRIIFNTTGGIYNTYVTKGCSALTITASNIKVLTTKSNVTYNTAGQVITS